MEKNKIKKSAAVFATTLIIIIVGVASFAYFGTFDVNLINNVAVNINAVSPGNASFVSSGAQLNLQVPAANMSQTNSGSVAAENNAVLTVNLAGAPNLLTKCTYDIVYEYDENSNVYGYGETPVTSENETDIGLAILDGTDEENIQPTTNGINYYSNGRTFNYFSGSNPTGDYDENDKWDSIRKRVLVRNASIISTGELVTQKWFIDMAYLNLPVSQEQLAGKAFTGKIYVENYDCGTADLGTYGYERILAYNGGKNEIEAKGTPDFSEMSPKVLSYKTGLDAVDFSKPYNIINDSDKTNSNNYFAYTDCDNISYNMKTNLFDFNSFETCDYSDTTCQKNIKGKCTSSYQASGKNNVNSTGLDRFYYLDDNEIFYESMPIPENIDYSTSGMYAAQDDLGMSYYFRGAVNNNWVKFGKYSKDYIFYKGSNLTASDYWYDFYNTLEECQTNYTTCEKVTFANQGDDMYWRIVRINGDGSIRMIYSGSQEPTYEDQYVMTGDLTTIGYYKNTRAYSIAGYQYISGQDHGYGKCGLNSDGDIQASCSVTFENENVTVENSEAKKFIENWYKKYTDLVTNKNVNDSIFCNDRNLNDEYINIAGLTAKPYDFGKRQLANSYSLICTNANDKFTVDSSNGNGALTYPVGLITGDEIALSGAISNNSQRNGAYYLYNNTDYWSMTMYFFHDGAYNGTAFPVLDYSGNIYYRVPIYTDYYRPVINLKSSVKLTGSGTYNDPYIVK